MQQTAVNRQIYFVSASNKFYVSNSAISRGLFQTKRQEWGKKIILTICSLNSRKKMEIMEMKKKKAFLEIMNRCPHFIYSVSLNIRMDPTAMEGKVRTKNVGIAVWDRK